ncbi:MAG TPA: flagellar FliJ family protein [Caulobacterales bacterium]|nr:flagellar FliJ family protein [Caulobacterales bacterium]
MKSLHTLLKLARRDLDLLRRALADQIAKRTAIEERIRTHEQSVLSEQKAALRDYDSHRAYGGFAAMAVAGKRALEAELVAVDAEAERLRVLISEAHVEMRKFERLLELETERERKAEEKRDAAELDEIATIRAGRQR